MSDGAFRIGQVGVQTGILQIAGSASGVATVTASTNGLLFLQAAADKNLGVDAGASPGSVRLSGINNALTLNIPVEIQATTLTLNTTLGQTIKFPGYGAGTLTTDAGGNVIAVSDERLKNIHGSFEAGLGEILALTPIRYHWNEKSNFDREHEYAGFSAQQVQGLIPLAVGENPDGTLNLQDRALIAALVNAVQELSAEVERLKGRG